MLKKKCSKCDAVKLISEFHRNGAAKDGHQVRCKDCMREYNLIHYGENKERILKQKRNITNFIKKKKSKHNSEYYELHREERKKQNREYQKTPNGKLSRIRSNHNRRALYKGKRSDITPACWAKILESQSNKCNICHNEFTSKRLPTQDHIVALSQGGSLQSDNIQALCQSCNSTKHAKSDNRFIQTWIYKNVETE